MEPALQIGMTVKIAGQDKLVTDVRPVKHGTATVGYIYEFDNDFDQRYSDNELSGLLADS